MNSEQSALVIPTNTGIHSSDGRFKVVADFGRSNQTLSRIQVLVKALTPLTPALVGAGIVGWIVTLFLLLRGNGQLAATLLGIVVVISLLAVVFPSWVRELSADIAAHTQRRAAQHKLANLLETHLDGNWTLYHEINADTTSLLVGARGIYLLDLLIRDHAAQVKGNKWLFRNADDEWELSDKSPTRNAAQRAVQLQRQLNAIEEINLFVQPRVVWAGEAVILLDEPATPVWWLAQVEGMVGDLRESAVEISAETLTHLHTELEKLIEKSQAQTFFV